MEFSKLTGLPTAQGLYDPAFERDACGVGYVVSIDGIKSNRVSTNNSDFLIEVCRCSSDCRRAVFENLS